ncbi:MAG: aspartate carbamoyltransferase catalytic subunit [Thermoanaerobaculia bacterium]|nr:aspartate carbamoyltransferase catalytic subunit [Thermoanaerobaculia bacterium]
MSETVWERKDLLGIAELEPAEIGLILDTAESFREVAERPIKKVPTLRGKTVVNLFFEPSTRTRSSFEIAEKRLSADGLNFSTSGSSLVKGENLIDTAMNLQAMAPDLIVIRHQHPGVPHMLARRLEAGVINAGDGAHEHPTQALLDAFTIRAHKGRLEGLDVAIVGDIEHSRVVRSNIHLLTKMGATVTVAGLRTMMPIGVESLGVRVVHRLEEAVADADVVMMLRVQKERLGGGKLFPSDDEYFQLFGLTRRHLQAAKPDTLVMHPGPMNRGVEIASDVADGPQSVILEQVANGVAVRMAILYLLSGAQREAA